MRSVVLLAAVLVLAACGTPATDEPSAGGTGQPSPDPAAETTEEAADMPEDSPEPVPLPTEGLIETEPTKPQPARTVTGTLGGDPDLEGGCVWIDTAQGRIQVLWPDGYKPRLGPIRLEGPEGQIVADVGEEVTIVAAPAPDMLSICQVGEMWRATEVVTE